MREGDKIKMFEDTDVNAYISLVHDMGFRCTIRKNYIVVGRPFNLSEEEKRTIGRSITKAMKKKGLSREMLAERLGIKNSYTIWQWQLGRYLPSDKYRDKLKRVLEVDINEQVQMFTKG